MKLVSEGGGRRAQPLLIEMARYFSRISSSGASCYEQRLYVLQNAGVWPTFCSLNHECLFEQVADQTGGASGNHTAPLTRSVRHAAMADSPAFLDSADGPSEVIDCAKVVAVVARAGDGDDPRPGVPPDLHRSSADATGCGGDCHGFTSLHLGAVHQHQQ